VGQNSGNGRNRCVAHPLLHQPGKLVGVDLAKLRKWVDWGVFNEMCSVPSAAEMGGVRDAWFALVGRRVGLASFCSGQNQVSCRVYGGKSSCRGGGMPITNSPIDPSGPSWHHDRRVFSVASQGE
jgi:hypothetical protein